MRRKLTLLSFARLVINQRDTSSNFNGLLDHRTAIGRIHQLVASIDPLGTAVCLGLACTTRLRVTALKAGGQLDLCELKGSNDLFELGAKTAIVLL